MRKKFKIELFAEIEIDCNQLLQESDILELASPKVIIKNYKDEIATFKVKTIELEHSIYEISEKQEEIMEVWVLH